MTKVNIAGNYDELADAVRCVLFEPTTARSRSDEPPLRDHRYNLRLVNDVTEAFAAQRVELEKVQVAMAQLQEEKDSSVKVVNRLRSTHNRDAECITGAEERNSQLLSELRVLHRRCDESQSEVIKLTQELAEQTSENEDLRAVGARLQLTLTSEDVQRAASTISIPSHTEETRAHSTSQKLPFSLSSSPTSPSPLSPKSIDSERDCADILLQCQQLTKMTSTAVPTCETPPSAGRAQNGMQPMNFREELFFEYSMNLTRFILESFIELEEPEREEDGSLRIEDLAQAADCKKMQTAHTLFKKETIQKIQNSFVQEMPNISEDELELLELQRSMLMEFRKVVEENMDLRSACLHEKKLRSDSENSLFSALRELTSLRKIVSKSGGSVVPEVKETGEKLRIQTNLSPRGPPPGGVFTIPKSPTTPASPLDASQISEIKRKIKLEMEDGLCEDLTIKIRKTMESKFADKVKCIMQERREEAAEVAAVISEKEAQIAELETENDALQKKVKKIKKAADQNIKINMEQFTALNDKLHAEIAQVDEVLTKLETQNEALLAEKSKQAAEITRLRQRITVKATDAHRFETELASSQRVVNQLRASIDTLEETNSSLKKDCEKLDDAASAVSSVPPIDPEKEKEAERIKNRIKDLENQLHINEVDADERIGALAETVEKLQRKPRTSTVAVNTDPPPLVVETNTEENEASYIQVDSPSGSVARHGSEASNSSPDLSSLEEEETTVRRSVAEAESGERIASLETCVWKQGPDTKTLVSPVGRELSRRNNLSAAVLSLQQQPTTEALRKLLHLGSLELAAGGLLESSCDLFYESSKSLASPFEVVSNVDLSAVLRSSGAESQLEELVEANIQTVPPFLEKIADRTLNSVVQTAFTTPQVLSMLLEVISPSDIRLSLLSVGWECTVLFAEHSFQVLLELLHGCGISTPRDLASSLRDPTRMAALKDSNGVALITQSVAERLLKFMDEVCDVSPMGQSSTLLNTTVPILKSLERKEESCQTEFECEAIIQDLRMKNRTLEERNSKLAAEALENSQSANSVRRERSNVSGQTTDDIFTSAVSADSCGKADKDHKVRELTLKNKFLVQKLMDTEASIPSAKRNPSLPSFDLAWSPHPFNMTDNSNDKDDSPPSASASLSHDPLHNVARTFSVDQHPAGEVAARKNYANYLDQEMQSFYARCLAPSFSFRTQTTDASSPVECYQRNEAAKFFEEKIAALEERNKETQQRNKVLTEEVAALCKRLETTGDTKDESELALLIKEGEDVVHKLRSSILLTKKPENGGGGNASPPKSPTAPTLSLPGNCYDSEPIALDRIKCVLFHELLEKFARTFPTYFATPSALMLDGAEHSVATMRQLCVSISTAVYNCIDEIRGKFDELGEQSRNLKKEIIIIRKNQALEVETLKLDHDDKWRAAGRDMKEMGDELHSLRQATQLSLGTPSPLRNGGYAAGGAEANGDALREHSESPIRGFYERQGGQGGAYTSPPKPLVALHKPRMFFCFF